MEHSENIIRVYQFFFPLKKTEHHHEMMNCMVLPSLCLDYYDRSAYSEHNHESILAATA